MRITVRSQPEQIVQDPILKIHHTQKRLMEWFQGVGPEFKPQYHNQSINQSVNKIKQHVISSLYGFTQKHTQ
jgi:hypothetical protein